MRPQDKFGQIKKDHMNGQNDIYNQISNAPAQSGGAEEFSSFEADAANRRNELLFSITNQVEETKAKLRQAELLVERLRQSLREYEEMYKTLTKGKQKDR
jgi:hypothetical protein